MSLHVTAGGPTQLSAGNQEAYDAWTDLRLFGPGALGEISAAERQVLREVDQAIRICEGLRGRIR